jgi:hypothetical protein
MRWAFNQARRLTGLHVLIIALAIATPLLIYGFMQKQERDAERAAAEQATVEEFVGTVFKINQAAGTTAGQPNPVNVVVAQPDHPDEIFFIDDADIILRLKENTTYKFSAYQPLERPDQRRKITVADRQ